MNKEEEIYSKVICLYRKYGVKSVTMDDVSRELGISKKTLYEYVRDKKDLVKKVMDYEFEYNKTVFNQLQTEAGNAIDHLMKVSQFMMEQIKDFSSSLDYDLKKYYPDIFENISENKNEFMHMAIIQNLKQGKEEGIYREAMNENIIAKLYITRMQNIHGQSFFTADEFVSPNVFLECFEYHIRGIANKKGIEIFEESLNKLTNNKE
jgi:TetR/AcrR family transcriptional regulator, cholesterol catabolism regulator